MSGSDLQSAVEGIYALPASVVSRAKQSLLYKPAR
jgi:hypothetical protein